MRIQKFLMVSFEIFNKWLSYQFNDLKAKIGRTPVLTTKLCSALKLKRKKNIGIFTAWSIFSNDFKYGNSHDFGNFTLCKGISKSQTSTQYCLIQYFNDQNPPIHIPPKQSFFQSEWTNLDVSFLGAVCLPSSCSSTDVKEAVKVVLDEKNLRIGERVYCRDNFNEENEFNFGRILWVIEGFLASLFFWFFHSRLYTAIVLTTLILSNSKTPRLNIFNILSEIANPKQKGNQPTSYFDGIKALTMILIIMDHAWYSRAFFPFKNGKISYEFRMNYAWTFLHTANVLMEFYIIIGAVLTVKTLKKGFDKR